MIKIINLFKLIKNKNFDDYALLFMAVFALIQGVYIYILKSSNEGLELALKNAEIEKAQMEAFIKNQQIAINELETAINKKEALSYEIQNKKKEIISKGGENAINKAVSDSASYIFNRLQSAKNRE